MSITGLGQTVENRRKTQMFTGNGFYAADSLWQDYTGVTDSTHQADTIKLNYQYEWFNITAIDTGTSVTDSIVVEYYTPDFTLAAGGVYTESAGSWNVIPFMRDSTWTNLNLIVSAGAYLSYKMHVADYNLIRIRMTNTQVVAGRVWKYRGQAVLKDNKIK